MRFRETEISGAFLVDLEPKEDDRGFFARAWCRDEIASRGLDADLAQASISYSRRKGTLRGLHYQAAPKEETKFVRCIRGAIFDVLLDLRGDSPSFRRWAGFELTSRNRTAIYVPKGVAHGFQTLEDETEVLYQMSEPYDPGSERGVRWNDPAFSIRWPIPDPTLSPRDRDRPDFSG
jgi:dTDP-4-dehydrorhamnose 3,5-epimerase